MNERWLPVLGYEGIYEVSDRGRVRSLDRLDSAGKRRLKGRVLKDSDDGGGYRLVFLNNAGTKRFSVHRLVLEAFVCERPDGMECCHWDGDKANNSLQNLRWGTKQENQADRVRHGVGSAGSKNPRAKINEDDVREIRYLKKSGLVNHQIAQIMRCSLSIVRNAVNGRTWSHVV